MLYELHLTTVCYDTKSINRHCTSFQRSVYRNFDSRNISWGKKELSVLCTTFFMHACNEHNRHLHFIFPHHFKCTAVFLKLQNCRCTVIFQLTLLSIVSIAFTRPFRRHSFVPSDLWHSNQLYFFFTTETSRFLHIFFFFLFCNYVKFNRDHNKLMMT